MKKKKKKLIFPIYIKQAPVSFDIRGLDIILNLGNSYISGSYNRKYSEDFGLITYCDITKNIHTFSPTPPAGGVRTHTRARANGPDPTRQLSFLRPSVLQSVVTIRERIR